MKTSKSAANLKELINHALHDLEITPQEYQSIMDAAHEDGHLDKEEKALSKTKIYLSNKDVGHQTIKED